jgi:hypothetical protein
MDAGGTSLAARQARLGLANSGSLAYNKAFEPIARPLASRRLNSVFGAQISFFQFCTLPQEIAMLALHLLQISLVYVNTLLIQDVLRDETWRTRLTTADYRGLTPLIYSHVNPYGTFQLDMTQRLPIVEARAA